MNGGFAVGVRVAIRAGLGLLSSRDRRRYAAVVILQMATSLFDLVGVLLLGSVVAIGSAAATGQDIPSKVYSLISALGLGDLSPLTLAGWLALAAGLLLISKSIVSMYLTRRTLRFLANRQAWVSSDLARRLLSQPLLFIQRYSSQKVAFALTAGVNAATIVILGATSAALAEFALLGILAAGLFFLDPVVTTSAIAFFGVVAFILQRIMSMWASRIGETNARAEIASIRTIQESMKLYREISVSNRRTNYTDAFGRLREEAASVQADLTFMNAAPKYVFEAALVVGGALLAVSQLVTKDLTAALSTITVFLVAATRIVPSLLRLQQAFLSIRYAAGTASSTFEISAELDTDDQFGQIGEISTSEDTWNRALSDTHPGFTAEIEIDHVYFAYPGSREIALDGISLAVSPGQSLAIVGSTGSGKSTLTDVLLGLIEPDRGRVLIGGVSPHEAIHRWPGAVAYVPQEVAIVDGSVRENVALGIPERLVDDARVLDALRRAHLDSFLHDQRSGIETLVGENGVALSGGQRQRLGIARALYTRPLLLVLDEATSALDAETERLIIDTLTDLTGEVTVVTIAHRLATVLQCDQVAYLGDGSLLAVGTFDEVRESVPKFDKQASLLGL